MVMKHRARFDDAHHVAIVGDRVYFGSAVDHQVRCVDAATGQTVWRFFTGGPVRLAPTVHQGRVYFGSDDGCVYCLDAATGQEVWKLRVGPRAERLLARGHMISRWPVRTGVLIADDVAYFGAGIFPHETVYLCAADARTGKLLWKNDRISQRDAGRDDLSPQGYLLANEDLLFVPSGNSLPAAFDRKTGEHVFKKSYGWRNTAGGEVGGTQALLERRAALLGRFASLPGAEREDRRRGLCLHSRPAVDLPRHEGLHRHGQGSDCRRSRRAPAGYVEAARALRDAQQLPQRPSQAGRDRSPDGRAGARGHSLEEAVRRRVVDRADGQCGAGRRDGRGARLRPGRRPRSLDGQSSTARSAAWLWRVGGWLPARTTGSIYTFASSPPATGAAVVRAASPKTEAFPRDGRSQFYEQAAREILANSGVTVGLLPGSGKRRGPAGV